MPSSPSWCPQSATPLTIFLGAGCFCLGMVSWAGLAWPPAWGHMLMAPMNSGEVAVVGRVCVCVCIFTCECVSACARVSPCLHTCVHDPVHSAQPAGSWCSGSFSGTRKALLIRQQLFHLPEVWTMFLAKRLTPGSSRALAVWNGGGSGEGRVHVCHRSAACFSGGWLHGPW